MMLKLRSVIASSGPVYAAAALHRRAADKRRSAALGGGGAVLRREQAIPEIGKRPGQLPGHVHLRDAELISDLRLGHVAVEPHRQHPLLTLRKLCPVPRADG